MGNKQSQEADEEGGPRYTLHEDVLREARRNAATTADPQSAGLPLPQVDHQAYLSDEEFFSADEGDSVGSITPPRTRPESSSGEDFSDGSDDDDDDNSFSQRDPDVSCENSSSGTFLVPSSPDETPQGSNKQTRRSTRSSDQCDASLTQDQDSIGPELDSNLRLSRNTTMDSRASSTRMRQSQRLLVASTNQSSLNTTGRQTPVSRGRSSPFQPIFSPPMETNESQTSSLILAAQAGKRKAQTKGTRAVDKVKVTVPVTRRTTRSSQLSQQRLGLINSSDSESELEGNQRYGKKGKYFEKSSIGKREKESESEQNLDTSHESLERRSKRRRSGCTRSVASDESWDDSSKKRRSGSTGDSVKNQSEEESPLHDIRKRQHSVKHKSVGRKERQSEESSDSEDSDSPQSHFKRSRLGSKRSSRSPRDGRRRHRARSDSRDTCDDNDFPSSLQTGSTAISNGTGNFETLPSRTKRLRIGAYNPPYSRPTSVTDNGMLMAPATTTVNQISDSKGNSVGLEAEDTTQPSTLDLKENSPNEPNAETCTNNNADSSGSPQQVPRIASPEQPPASVSPSVESVRQETDSSNTSKMGDQGVRNVHGKVLPVKHKNVSDNASLSTAVETSKPSLPNLRVDLRTKNSAFSTPAQGSQLEKRREGNACINVNNSSDTAEPARGLMSSGRSSAATEAYFSAGEEQETLPSPLRNIKLVPTSETRNQNNSDSQGLKRRRSEEQLAEGICRLETDMEVDTGANSFLINEQPRSILIGKRSGKSAADRFKNFWSKRKNIGTNLKTFFSNVKSPISKSPSVLESMSKVKQHILPSSPTQKRELSMHLKPQSSSQSSSSLFNKKMFQLRDTRSGQPTSQYHSGRDMVKVSVKPGQQLSLPSWRSPGLPTRRISLRLQPRVPTVHSTGTQTPDTEDNQSAHLVELLPQTSLYEVLHFQLANILEVSVCMGDISEQLTAGIVNWTDGALSHTVTECSQNIAAKAGAVMRVACKEYLETKGGLLEAPDVFLTPAGGKFDSCVETILHVTTPAESDLEDEEEHCIHSLLEVYINCLRFSNERLGLNSVSFPLIGQDVFPAGVCVRAFLNSLLVYLAELSLSATANSTLPNLSCVSLVINDAVTTDFAADFLHQCLESISADGLEQAVTDIYNHFSEQSQRQWAKPNKSPPTVERSPMKHSEVFDNPLRSPSGRPKLKRRRL